MPSKLVKFSYSSLIVGLLLWGVFGYYDFVLDIDNEVIMILANWALFLGVFSGALHYFIPWISPILKRKSAMSELSKLKQLKEDGVLTQAEFDTKASELKKNFI